MVTVGHGHSTERLLKTYRLSIAERKQRNMLKYLHEGGFVVFSLKHKAKPMLGHCQIRGLMTRSPLAPILVTHIVFASVRSETFQPKLSRMISYTNPLFLHCNWQCCMSTVASYYFQNVFRMQNLQDGRRSI